MPYAPQKPTTLADPGLPPAEAYPPEYGMDPRRLFHTILERAWIILVCLVVFAALGAAYIHQADVLYSSTATIQVERDIAPVFQEDAGQFRDLQALDFLQTVVQSLKARPLLERVAASNNLATNPAFLPPPDDGRQRTHAELMKALEEMVTVKLRRGTRLIDITVNHSSPVLAEKIANSLVGQYTSENAERHTTSAEVANESLLKEAERLRKKLQESEIALQSYKEQSKASSLDDRQNTVVAALKELSTKLTEAKSTRIKAESDYSQARELGTNIEALITLPTLAADPAVVAARLNVSKAEGDFAALRQRYKEKHPKYIQAQTQVEALRHDLSETVLKAARTIEANLARSRASETALAQELRAQEAEALELNKLAIQYSVLAREVESDRALYDSVLKSMKETSVTKELNPVRVRVVQPAYVADKPVSPRKVMILGMSVMAGLCAGFMLVMGMGFLDSSVKTVDDAETMFQLPVLATVANLKEVRKRQHPLVVLDEEQSSGAESFRTLRTSLSMLGRVEDRRIFLFTSSLPQEGKTFCSINYASSLAQLGLKTLLIDGDLRRPTVESTLVGRESRHPGVTDYLTGQKQLSEIIQSTRQEGLFFISGGTIAPNPAELLAKDGLTGLIEEALKSYDRVVVDSAPIHAVSDTLLMVKSVQTVCLVIRAAYTSSRSVARCIQLLGAAGAPLSGLILNRMPVRRRLSYGYSSPYYDYKYSGKYSKKGVYGS